MVHCTKTDKSLLKDLLPWWVAMPSHYLPQHSEQHFTKYGSVTEYMDCWPHGIKCYSFIVIRLLQLHNTKQWYVAHDDYRNSQYMPKPVNTERLEYIIINKCAIVIHKVQMATVVKLTKRHVHVPNMHQLVSYQSTKPPYRLTHFIIHTV